MTEIYVPDKLLYVIDALAEKGFDGYLVGGCVRDRVMGKTPNDYDVTTSSLPEETKEVFKNHRVIETGIKHGTVTVLVEGDPIEITTFRIDGEYKDNRHPESVSFTRNIESDLARRDFTVNAMAYNPRLGFVDPFDGMGDIERRLIRCVGAPDKRFNEDGLRILRALRFSSVLGFEIHPETKDSIKRNKQLLSGIAVERICVEFLKLICGINAESVLREYNDVISVFAKGIDTSITAELVANAPGDPIIRLSVMLSQSSQNTVCDFLHLLKTDNNTVKNVTELVSAIKQPAPDVKRDIKYFIAEHGKDFCKAFAEAKSVVDTSFDKAFFMQSVDKILSEASCLRISELAVNGDILYRIGIPKGKDMGRILTQLLHFVMDEVLPNEMDALANKAIEIFKSEKKAEVD